jgi:hypothetical protein
MEMAKAVPTTALLAIMNGDGEEEGVDESTDSQSPVKNNPKKISPTTTKSTTWTKNKVKSALKASYSDTHVHNFPRVLAEASVTLKNETSVQEFIINLQELLKNGQLVVRKFAFCPVKDDRRVKKIKDPASMPTNMTLLSAYFKISSSKGWNSLGKQKAYKNNKEVQDQVQEPAIYFAFVFATDSEKLLARVSNEWHNRSGNILKDEELQTF